MMQIQRSSFLCCSDPRGLETKLAIRLEQERLLTSLLRAVSQEISELLAAKKRLFNAKRPVVRLPTEILCTIFEFVCLTRRPEEDQSTVRFGNAIRKNRTLLTSICCRWRSIALQDASLWSTIVVTSLDRNETSPTHGSVTLELQRAGSRPLSLFIGSAGSQNASKLLRTELQRCEALDLRCQFKTTETIPSAIIREVSQTSPVFFLRFLSLTTMACRSEAVDVRNCPNLKYLWVDRRLCATHAAQNSRYTTLMFPAMARGLSRLHLSGYIASQSILDALRVCTHLEIFEWVQLRDGENVDITSTQPIHLPLLRHLRVNGHTPCTSLGHFLAPNLAQLHVSDPGPRGDWLTSHLLFENLARLRINYSRRSTSRIAAAWIVAHPQLEEIELVGTALNSIWVQCFGPIVSPDFSLRKLRHLTVSVSELRDGYDFRYVRQLLALRSNDGDEIPRLRLSLVGQWRTERRQSTWRGTEQKSEIAEMSLDRVDYVDALIPTRMSHDKVFEWRERFGK